MITKIAVCVGFFFLILMSGCSDKSHRHLNKGQGTVIYSLTYPDSINYGIKTPLLPQKIMLVFKDDKATFVALAGFGMIQVINILDHREKKYTSLLIDDLRGNYACTLTREEINENENSGKFEFENTNDEKIIAGVVCNKAIVKNLNDKSESECYFDKKINFNYRNSPFKDFNYLLMQYTHTMNNLTMKLTAIEADFTTPVDTGLFEVKGSYNWVSQKQLFERLNKL